MKYTNIRFSNSWSEFFLFLSRFKIRTQVIERFQDGFYSAATAVIRESHPYRKSLNFTAIDR